MALAIPLDSAQFVWHAIILAQKLAYLYGWPDLLEDGTPDDETQLYVALLMGSMFGSGNANKVLTAVSKDFALRVVQHLPKQPLTKTIYYPVIKQVLKSVGIKITKKSFASGIAKLIPLISGAIGAAMTTFVLRRMARKLKRHLRKLEYAKPSR